LQSAIQEEALYREQRRRDGFPSQHSRPPYQNRDEADPGGKGDPARGGKACIQRRSEKISKLPPEQQAEASSLLVSGEIKTVDEFPVKQPDIDATENKPMANLPPEQTAAIMDMAYLADEVNGHVRDFLRQEETFSTLSRNNIRYIMEMLFSMRQSLDYLRDMLVDCY